MTDVNTSPGPRSGSAPVLLYGTGGPALDILAAALGRREQRPFAWIHCAPDDSDVPTSARDILTASSEGNREFLKDARELTVPEHRVRRLSMFFLDEPMTLSFEVRLVAYLGMPAIVQRMVSRVLTADGRSMIVLTHLDAVPPKIALECFARPEVLTTMRREGASMIATYHGTPPKRLKRAFARVFRVDALPGRPWAEAEVTPEEGHHPTCGAATRASAGDWVAYLAKDPTGPPSTDSAVPARPDRARRR